MQLRAGLCVPVCDLVMLACIFGWSVTSCVKPSVTMSALVYPCVHVICISLCDFVCAKPMADFETSFMCDPMGLCHTIAWCVSV